MFTLYYAIFGWNATSMFPVFLKRSLVLAFLLFSSISLHCSWKKAFLSLLAILWNSAFSWVCAVLSCFSHVQRSVTLWICSLPGSSVHEILQARILEWVAMPSSRGSSPPRDQTQISHMVGTFFTTEPSGKLVVL